MQSVAPRPRQGGEADLPWLTAAAARAGVNPGPRFLLYSHDAVGLGHVRRNLAIAEALTRARPDASVLLATSIDEAGDLGLAPNVDLLRLPGLCKTGAGYAARRLSIEPSDIHGLRSELLLAAVRSFRPSVLLSDRHPLGIDAELRPALEALRAAGGRAVLGLRDIVDEPAAVRAEFIARGVHEAIEQYYDEVLVYGQASILDPRTAYGLADAGQGSMTFCGYVVGERVLRVHVARRGRPVVVATVGGGEDGAALLEAFILGSIDAPWRAIAVAGPQAPAPERERLKRLARAAGVDFRVFVPTLASLLSSIDVLVSMGGYNTLAEALASETPTVCIPRTRPRQEQAIRARLFAALGLLEVVEPDGLTPEKVRAAVTRALARPRGEIADVTERVLSFDGAGRAADRLLALAERGQAGIGSAEPIQ
jgi:predicted glycosyltransferase